ncbi:MAG: Mur ligase family protein [Anaerolineae bacterium]
MRFETEAEAITYIFRSMRKLRDQPRGYDEDTRDVAPTRRLLMNQRLLDTTREYAVVTGSKGKGSTTAITAKILQHLGHRVGMISSPHLVSWRERIRVGGQAIPEADLCRILDGLADDIDAIENSLSSHQYFSPQGIFLAVALKWFNELNVTAAVLEVGRGGRFDDIAVVPNKLSLFTPIMLEHREYLGPTLERIAWHKAGIIKPMSNVYSLPQQPAVLDVLRTEAEALGAEFNWIAPKDIGVYLGLSEDGIRIDMGRYGEVSLALRGHYQVANATLAVIAAGNMHARLRGVSHGSAEYIAAVRAGLTSVKWPGRCQKLQDHPVVFVDGAINRESASLLVESLEGDLKSPVISVVSVPADKDYEGVYEQVGRVSQSLILTETERNRTLHWLPQAEAVEVAQRHNQDVSYARSLVEAVDLAKKRAGEQGTIIIVGTQSIVAEATGVWGQSCEVI